MKNNFSNINLTNIYSKPSSNSEVTSQILYGEKFQIISKNKNWIKIKTKYDNYFGFIKNKKFLKKFKATHKISRLKAKIFKKKNGRFLFTKNFLYFGSGINAIKSQKKYFKFDKNKWIKKNNTKKIDHYEKDFNKILKLFLNTRYLWGGRTARGIDCSALVQIYFFYNRIFFPRDSKDQKKFCKKKTNKKFSKGDIIFWKGHVGLCIDRSKFIHAYGPKKKVLIMPTNKTIELINKTANLKVKKVSNIRNY